MIDGRVIYIVKKEHTGKACKFFFAYDYETKIQLHFSLYKDELINLLETKDLKVLDEASKV